MENKIFFVDPPATDLWGSKQPSPSIQPRANTLIDECKKILPGNRNLFSIKKKRTRKLSPYGRERRKKGGGKKDILFILYRKLGFVLNNSERLRKP